jgi:hypothetical protein
MFKSMKYLKEPTGNQTRDIPECSAMPQPSAPPRTPKGEKYILYF